MNRRTDDLPPYSTGPPADQVYVEIAWMPRQPRTPSVSRRKQSAGGDTTSESANESALDDVDEDHVENAPTVNPEPCGDDRFMARSRPQLTNVPHGLRSTA
jgi:hypothetical protein